MPHGRPVFVALQSKPVKPEPVYVFEQVDAKHFGFLTGAASKQEKDVSVKCEGDQRGEAEMQALFCSVFPVLFFPKSLKQLTPVPLTDLCQHHLLGFYHRS